MLESMSYVYGYEAVIREDIGVEGGAKEGGERIEIRK